MLSLAFWGVSACAAQTVETAATVETTPVIKETSETSPAEIMERATESAVTVKTTTAAEITSTAKETSETSPAEATERATEPAVTTKTTTAAETTSAEKETSETSPAETTERATESAVSVKTTTAAETASAVKKTSKTSPAETTRRTTKPAATVKTTTAAETTSAVEETSKTTAEETAEKEEIVTQEKERKVIALTFDDGPNTTTTNEVLDVLEKYGIKASFFLIGNNINDESAKAVKRAYDMGCEIGNHSRSHSYMDKLSAEEIVEEVTYVNEKVIEITGEAPTFFRPPYIAVNDTMFETIEMPFIAGYGANDWEDRVTAERRAQMVLRQAKNGAVILLHDAQGNSKTVEALDTIIPELQAQGYEFVTISEVFRECGAEPKAHDRRIYSYAGQTTMYG